MMMKCDDPKGTPGGDHPPALAPPGAGLPKIEMLVGRFLLRRIRRMSWRERDALFEAERERILELARSRSPEEASMPVLIGRPRGLEDSSRYWSVYMTLDHLRIVNAAIVGIIRSLGRGREPGLAVRIADIKPSTAADAASLEGFEQACRLLRNAARRPEGFATHLRHPHPWFGPLDLVGWHALAAMHQRIHRVQIERVVAGLAS